MIPAPPGRRWVLAALGLLASNASVADDGWRFGPGAGVSRGDFRFNLTGYVQADLRRYPNWDVDESEGPLRADDREVRRVRVGFEGRWRRLAFELDVDPQQEGDRLKDAYLELRVGRKLRLRGGHFKPPISPEFLTSAAKVDFIERSLLAGSLAPARDWGGMVHGELGRAVYQVGLFAGDGRTRDERAETTAAARLLVTVADGFDVGASYAQGTVEAVGDARGLEPQPKGFLGASPSGFAYYVRHHVKGRRLRLGLDAAYTRGPWAVKAEALQGRERRLGQGAVLDDLPEEVATGWAVSGTWLVTGEKKERTIKPRRSLPGGPGAVEVGLRFESLRFDDVGPDAGFEGAGSRARNIRPAADRVLTGGVSWWPSRWIRLTGNVVVERYLDGLLAPERERRGNYLTLLGRMQVQVP